MGVKNQNRNASKQENQDYFFKIDPVMNQEGNLGDITSSGNSTEANLSEDENLRPVAGWNFSESDQTPRQRLISISGSGVVSAQNQPRRNVTILDMPNTTSTLGGIATRSPQQDFMGELSRNFQSNLSEMGNSLQRQASRGPASAASAMAARIATVAGSRDLEDERIRQMEARQQQQQQNTQEQNQQNSDAGTEESDDTFPFSGFFRGMVRTNPELAGVLSACEKYIPFVLILIIKQLYDHSTGIFVCMALIATFYHANSVVCREVSRNGRRALWPLLIVMVNLTACIGLIYFVFEDEKLYLCALFIPNGTAITSLSELLWIVGVNNFVLKFVSVIVKIIVILLPATVLLHRKRGNYFLFIELTSQLHRTLVPIPVWLFYLLDHNDRIPAKVLGVILTAAYMVFKGKSILITALAWKVAASKLLQSTRYGLSPSHDELKATGGTCPICHDNLSDPTKLHCKHIFCEECVTTWFDREKTCPMCRAQVTEDPSWRDGSTSQFIQLF